MIKRIEIVNLCCVDRLEINTASESVLMLVGGSGGGKTTIVGSLFACFYGSYPDKPDVSLYNDVLDYSQPASITVDIKIGDIVYSISRIIDAKEQKSLGYVYDLADASKPIVGPQIKPFNAWIERNVMDKDSFLSITYLSQSTKGDICELPPSYASDALIKLFSLKNVTDISKQFQSVTKELNSENVACSYELQNIVDAKFKLDNYNIDKRKLKADLESLQLKITNLDIQLEELSSAVLTGKPKEIYDKSRKIDGEISSLTSGNENLRKKKELYQSQIDNVQNAACRKGKTFEYPKCPLLNVESLVVGMDSIDREISTNNNKLIKLGHLQESLKKEISEYESSDGFASSLKRTALIDERGALLTKASGLNQQLGNNETLIKQCEELIAKEGAVKAKQVECSQRLKYADFIHRALDREGAPALVINQALPEINRIANDLCNEFSLPFNFDISYVYEKRSGDSKEALNITLKDNAGKQRHVTSFSGGEKQMARMVFRFSLHRYLKEVNNKNFIDIFIGDEIWSGMDASLRKSAIDMIKKNDAFGQIIVVSHMFDVMNEFSDVYEVYKEADRTRVKEVL